MSVLTIKQTEALDILWDDTTTELIFGGGAGGAKSYLGCYDILKKVYKYPKTRWLIGRSKLKTLRATTLKTLYEVMRKQGITKKNYKLNSTDWTFTFDNGSEIVLKDLFLYPSDPEFDSLGSLEITGAFVDECNQITYKAWKVLKSRIRYKLGSYSKSGEPTSTMEVIERNDFGVPIMWRDSNGELTRGLKPTILGTCNPAKNWVFEHFYLKNESQTLDSDKKFIQSLATDNPYLHESYIKNLQDMPDVTRKRLLDGDWRYDDDPKILFDSEAVLDLFHNNFLDSSGKETYLTCDLAALGSDLFVCLVWRGLEVIEIKTMEKSNALDIVSVLEGLKKKHSIPNSNICIDGDGMGSLFKSVFEGSLAFTANTSKKAIYGKSKFYKSLKDQCTYLLAVAINKRLIWVSDKGKVHKELIKQELSAIKNYTYDEDVRNAVTPKQEIKKIINRSPDYTDAMIQRMYIALKRRNRKSAAY